ncbi:MAG: endonuclease/exonuclease/phosphatase family protein [bacterium]|nr:endonuclease/exonuclease/phosphatase family protein [bacterium]
MQLKILSWNIWCDGDFEKTCEFLRASNADIIGIQEVMPEDKTRDITSYLSGLGYEYAISPKSVTFDDGRTITTAVFSKVKVHPEKPHTLLAGSPQQAEMSIVVRDRVFHIFSIHLKHTHQQEADIQKVQVESLLGALPKENVMVMGDFNATPKMTSIKRMREVLTDTDSGELPTLNAPLFDCKTCDKALLPTTKLDYIFVSADVRTHSFKVERVQGSDHFPVLVLLEV